MVNRFSMINSLCSGDQSDIIKGVVDVVVTVYTNNDYCSFILRGLLSATWKYYLMKCFKHKLTEMIGNIVNFSASIPLPHSPRERWVNGPWLIVREEGRVQYMTGVCSNGTTWKRRSTLKRAPDANDIQNYWTLFKFSGCFGDIIRHVLVRSSGLHPEDLAKTWRYW